MAYNKLKVYQFQDQLIIMNNSKFMRRLKHVDGQMSGNMFFV